MKNLWTIIMIALTIAVMGCNMPTTPETITTPITISNGTLEVVMDWRGENSKAVVDVKYQKVQMVVVIIDHNERMSFLRSDPNPLPWRIENIEFGSHEINIIEDGENTYFGGFEIKAGETTSVNIIPGGRVFVGVDMRETVDFWADKCVALGTFGIELTFPSPLDLRSGTGVFYIDGKDTPGRMNVMDYDRRKVIISLASPITIGAHTLTLETGALITEDLRKINGCGYVVILSADTSCPTLLSVKVLTRNSAVFTFSKPVRTPYDWTFSWTNDPSIPGTFSRNFTTRISNYSFVAEWGIDIPTGEHFFVAQCVQDFSGNTMSPWKSWIKATVD